jgi:hypothetical protein
MIIFLIKVALSIDLILRTHTKYVAEFSCTLSLYMAECLHLIEIDRHHDHYARLLLSSYDVYDY